MKTFTSAVTTMVFAIIACLIISLPANGQNPPDYGVQVGFGSSVGATIPKGDTMFVGGEFDYVGFYTGSMVSADLATGAIERPFPIVNGTVRVMIDDGSGGYYIGGDFSRVDNYLRSGFAHIRSDKTLDLAWDVNTNPGGSVYALLLSVTGDTLFIGGTFSQLGGVTKNAVAAIRVDTRTVIGGWGPGSVNANWWAPATVSALAFFHGNATDPVKKLFIGGDFQGFNWSVNKANLAALNPATGVVIPAWRADITPFPHPTTGGGVTPVVRALAVNPANGRLYIGGIFRQVTTDGGTYNRHSLAGIYLQNNGVFDNFNVSDRVNPKNESGLVNCLKLMNDGAGVAHLGIGGKFAFTGGGRGFVMAEMSSGSPRRYISTPPWTPIVCPWVQDTTYTPGVYDNGEVHDFEITGSTIVFAGDFEGAQGNDGPSGAIKVRRNLVKMDMMDCIIQDWFPVMQTNLPVRAISISGGKVHAAGSFTSAGGELRRNMAAVKLSNRTILPLNLRPDSYVNDFEFSVTKDTLYLGGNFTTLGGTPRGYTAALNIRTNTLLPWSTTVAAGGGVEDIVIDPVRNIMYAGGKFNSMAGSSRSHMAALNSRTGSLITNWTADVTTINGQITPVRSLALSVTRDTLFIGGRFNTIAGQPRRNLAAVFNTVTSSPVGATATLLGWDFPVVESSDIGVASLLIDKGRLYVGGKYTSINGNTSLSNLAAINMSTNTLNTSWAPQANGGGGGVWCMQAVGGTLYIGGDFGAINGVPTSFAGAITISDGSIISAWRPYPTVQPFGGVILTLYVYGPYVYLGGSHTSMRESVNDAIFHIATIPAFEFLPPLPIKLDYFNATAVGKSALIQWSASGDAAEYTLERSTGGGIFISLGTFTHASNIYTDRQVEAGGNYYYRLRISEKDKIIYSPVRKITIKGNDASLPVWMAGNNVVRMITPGAGYHAQIYAGNGQSIVNRNLKQGVNDIYMNTAAGVYFYVIQKDGKRETGKLLVR